LVELSGDTALTEQFGDQAAAERVGRLGTCSRNSLPAMADGWSSRSAMAMLVLPDPAAAGGLEMVEQVQEAGSCRRGWVSHRDRSSSETGDCSGRVVNLAARVMDRARPGQVLATLEVVAVTPREQARFQDLGPVQLKGIAAPIELSVAWRPG